MAQDDEAMDVDKPVSRASSTSRNRPSPRPNGSPRRMGIDFVTLGMFIIGTLSILSPYITSNLYRNAADVEQTQTRYTSHHPSPPSATSPAAQDPSQPWEHASSPLHPWPPAPYLGSSTAALTSRPRYGTTSPHGRRTVC